MLLTSMSEYEEDNKVNKEIKDSCDNDDKNLPILQKTIIPSDINGIQPRTTQVWNFDKFGFDPNIIWSKVIRTYKFFQVEQMWKFQTG